MPVIIALGAYVLCLQRKSIFPSWSRGFEPRLPLHVFNKIPSFWALEIEVADGKHRSIWQKCQPCKSVTKLRQNRRKRAWDNVSDISIGPVPAKSEPASSSFWEITGRRQTKGFCVQGDDTAPNLTQSFPVAASVPNRPSPLTQLIRPG